MGGYATKSEHDAYLEGFSETWSWLWDTSQPQPGNPYPVDSPEYDAWNTGASQAEADW